MQFTPFVLEVGLLILLMAVIIYIAVMRPHRADVDPYPKELSHQQSLNMLSGLGYSSP